MHPSGVAQAIAFALLDNWGMQGFKDHCHTVAQFYKHQRDVFEAGLNKHLSGMVEYTSPIAGMFFWCVDALDWQKPILTFYILKV